MFVASFKTSRGVNVVFGLLTAAAAAHVAMAEITNATFGRTVLPIHPLT